MLATLRQRNFALLWFGGLISITGSTMLFVALPFYVYQLSHSTLATGAMFIAQTLPGVLLGTLAGVFVDRWDRKRTMVIADLSRAVLLLLLLMVRSVEWVWMVYVVAFLQSAVSQFFGPAENALLPRLVGEEHLVAANSLNALNNNVGMLIGPSIGGALIGLLGLPGVVLFNSASHVISSMLILLISRPTDSAGEMAEIADPPPAGETAAATRAPLWREWLEGLRLVKEDRVVSTIFAAAVMVLLAEGILHVLLVPFMDVLHGGALEFGWILTLRGLGGLVGGLVVGRLGGALAPTRLFPLSLLAMGLLGLINYNFPTLSLALAVFFLIGVPAVASNVSSQTLLQTDVPESCQGRIFGALETTVALSMLCGQGLNSALADRFGVMTMLNMGSGLYILAGAVALMIMGRDAGSHRGSGGRDRRSP